jgi:hypothetical protein
VIFEILNLYGGGKLAKFGGISPIFGEFFAVGNGLIDFP